MNRSRTQQLLKIDKENENKDIKTKQKIGNPKGNVTTNSEKSGQLSGKQSSKNSGSRTKTFYSSDPPTYYQQLNKNRLNTGTAVQNDTTTSATDSYVRSIGMFPNHKRLSPYMAPTPGPKPRLGQKQIKRPAKEVASKKKQEEDVSLLTGGSRENPCVLELFTSNDLGQEESSTDIKNDCGFNSPGVSVSKILHSPRSKPESARLGSASPRSAADERFSTCSDSSTYLNLDLCSLDSQCDTGEMFFMAPLLPVPNTINSSDSSATLDRKVRNVLKAPNNSIEEDDIKVVKSVLQTDERHSLLKSRDVDPDLFKDILRTQLKEIVRNEKVIKTALKRLGASPEKPYGIAEIAELLSLRSKKGSERVSARKSRKKQHSVRRGGESEESSPDRIEKSISDAERQTLLSEAIDAHSVKHSHSFYEKSYAYSHHDIGKTKQVRRATSEEAQREYQEFLRSNLSVTQKLSIKNPETNVTECPSQVDMQLNVLDITEDDDPSSKSKIAKRPQVNVTFKNVTSLEKEILILRALGDRLEATLKRSLSEPSLTELEKKPDIPSASSMLSLTKELRKIDPSIKVYPGRRIHLKAYGLKRLMNVLPWTQQRAGCLVFAMGLRHKMGVVNEFVIVSKTIDELKCDANSSFYIPKSGHLERTSFEKLKAEPQVLLQNLKPKTQGVPFNLLDHDPIFFNSLLKPPIATVETERLPILTTAPGSSGSVKVCEGGDSRLAAAEGLRKTVTNLKPPIPPKRSKSAEPKPREHIRTVPQQVEKVKERPQSSSSDDENPKSTAYLLGGDSSILNLNARRSRIRRLVTPMPFDAFDEPKNNLLKKVLIGVIQVSIFMGLIMALTLPDIRC